jgi:hypothetical protein
MRAQRAPAPRFDTGRTTGPRSRPARAHWPRSRRRTSTRRRPRSTATRPCNGHTAGSHAVPVRLGSSRRRRGRRESSPPPQASWQRSDLSDFRSVAADGSATGSCRSRSRRRRTPIAARLQGRTDVLEGRFQWLPERTTSIWQLMPHLEVEIPKAVHPCRCRNPATDAGAQAEYVSEATGSLPSDSSMSPNTRIAAVIL